MDLAIILCYIVGLGLNCKFIDLLFKHLFNIFIKISLYLNFIVLESKHIGMLELRIITGQCYGFQLV